MSFPLAVPLALGIDALLGEPRRFHPLVGFGSVASAVERRLNGQRATRFTGVGALLLVVTPVVVGVDALIVILGPFAPVGEVFVLWLALGGRALQLHADGVREALAANDLPAARKAVGRMVSRDTDDMTPSDVARAAIESTLENGCDALFGALFWFAIAGAPGVVAYRLVNTLDAMWGYKTERYLRFGWGAARLDDLLNYVPARLTALTYALTGDRAKAFACWRTQGKLWESPNAGPVMAAGAGALGLTLGGPDKYHGVMKERPLLGNGRAAVTEDIDRAWTMVALGMLLWGLVIPLIGFAGRLHG